MLLGEAKHGVWRIQDNGHIREYRRYGKDGLLEKVEPNKAGLTREHLEILKSDYTSYAPEDKSLYKAPTDRVRAGYQQYVDLTIYHPKYGGKYDDHVPIDLSHFYCTMTQAEYPHAWKVWQYATMQPAMNKIGPLGKRAGKSFIERL